MAARLLLSFPTSEIIWFLNLEVFGIFERARATRLGWLFDPASVWLGAALLVLVAVFAHCRFRFGIAVLANCSFLAALLLAGCNAGIADSAASWPADLAGRLIASGLLTMSGAAALAGHISSLRDTSGPDRAPAP